MFRYFTTVTLVIASIFSIPVYAQVATEAAETEPDRIRGRIDVVNDTSLVLKTNDGASVELAYSDNLSILSLTTTNFTEVDFGVYVGSISKRLDTYSPIVRDSLSWLHQGFELRIFDEQLRGLALGHTSWDLTPESVMTHGWVDDLEVRVLSIKYGPTEEEETDVDISREVPILKLSIGDQSLMKPGAHVFAGALKGQDGVYEAVFLMIGENGVIPPL